MTKIYIYTVEGEEKVFDNQDELSNYMNHIVEDPKILTVLAYDPRRYQNRGHFIYLQYTITPETIKKYLTGEI